MSLLGKIKKFFGLDMGYVGSSRDTSKRVRSHQADSLTQRIRNHKSKRNAKRATRAEKKSQHKKRHDDARFPVEIAAALRSQGYSGQVANAAAKASRGESFDARLRDALRLAAYR